jgi:signal transduction histidine kinase
MSLAAVDSGGARRLEARRGSRLPALLDAQLEAAYQRLGWRLFGAYVAAAWLAALVMAVIGGIGMARIQRLSLSAALELLGLLLAIVLVGIPAGVGGSVRLMRPLRALDRDASAEELAAAWQAGQSLPVRVSALNGVIALLWIVPASILDLAWVAPGVDTALVVLIVLFAPIGLTLAMAAGVFGAQLVMSPINRDLARRLGRLPEPRFETPVRLKLLVLVPAITITTAGWGVLLGAVPGENHVVLLRGFVIALVATLIVVVPITLLLAYSMLAPLDDLLQATNRLKVGNFDVPVPELSADEYGRLGRSLNQAMAGLAERQRLARENQHLLDAVRQSRARIVAASDAERRRVERNIHDGAQQRLVALSLELRMLQDRAAAREEPELEGMAAAAGTSLRAALQELRELARGLHPPVLEADGLAAAVRQLAARSPVPVTARIPDERLPTAIESTAYFVLSEGLANVAKYSQASSAEVSVTRAADQLVVEITDDGIGGAVLGAGSGLSGLADRVAALDGRLELTSPAGAGTRLRAELPLEVAYPRR